MAETCPMGYTVRSIRANFLFAGYRQKALAESAIGVDGYFSTGGLGVLTDGHVYVLVRLEEIIIINVKNIFAGNVEDLPSQLPGVKEGRVVAFGMDSEQTGGEELIVVAEHDPVGGVDAADTRAAISRLLSESLPIKPRDARVVDRRWLVKSTSGKISRAGECRKYIVEFRTISVV